MHFFYTSNTLIVIELHYGPIGKNITHIIGCINGMYHYSFSKEPLLPTNAS